jgi:lysyl-tRNA synthetase class 2
MNWKPSASLKAVQARAALYQTIREFFSQRDVLEVDVPLLSAYATVDPFIESMVVEGSTSLYLQTSPEFFLKRFLAAYQTDCYYLGKAFRQEERGARHNPEFTMLEWYRVGWDDRTLADEVVSLIQPLLPTMDVVKTTYAELFLEYTDIDPHSASVKALRDYASARFDLSFDSDDKNTWLDIIFTHSVEPHLPKGIVVVHDYAQSQAALARIEPNKAGVPVARRFEVYVNGIELANGYWELTDAVEQQQRFEKDLQYREQQCLPLYPYDKKLIAALGEEGFPVCAGVALGVDRLLMCLLSLNKIQQILAFE